MSEERVCYQCGGFGCHHCGDVQQSERPVDRLVMQPIDNWQQLAAVEDSETHRLKIEDGAGWIIRKADGEIEEYLSTHTFYGSQYAYSSRLLQKYGFNVELANWDA